MKTVMKDDDDLFGRVLIFNAVGLGPYNKNNNNNKMRWIDEA